MKWLARSPAKGNITTESKEDAEHWAGEDGTVHPWHERIPPRVPPRKSRYFGGRK